MDDIILRGVNEILGQENDEILNPEGRLMIFVFKSNLKGCG